MIPKCRTYAFIFILNMLRFFLQCTINKNFNISIALCFQLKKKQHFYSQLQLVRGRRYQQFKPQLTSQQPGGYRLTLEQLHLIMILKRSSPQTKPTSPGMKWMHPLTIKPNQFIHFVVPARIMS